MKVRGLFQQILPLQFLTSSLMRVSSSLPSPFLLTTPFREPSYRIAEPIFKEAEGGFDVIVHKAELCRSLLDQMKADVVHMDLSLGCVSNEELTPVELVNLRTSKTGRQNILKNFTETQKNHCEIKRIHAIDTLAIGKESVLVRIAGLNARSEAILFACKRVTYEVKPILPGSPIMYQPTMYDNRIYLNSLIPSEHDVPRLSC